jgi:hypothetical protein
MRLSTRLRVFEAKLRPDDKAPRLVIVFDDGDGVWRDWQGNAVDRAALGPWVRVIRLVERPDGPP